MWEIIPSLLNNVIGIFFDSPEVKAAKEEGKVELAKLELEIKKENMAYAAKAESDYDTTAQANMKSTWKDEYLILLHTLPIYGYAIPNETLHKGLDSIWAHLEAAPYEWWIVYIGMIASTFGLRWLLNKSRIDKMMTGK